MRALSLRIFSIALLLAHACGLSFVALKRIQNLKKVAGLVTASIALGSDPSFADMIPAPWSSAVKYEILQPGTGESPKAGDLVEIRFKGLYKGNVFDNTFTTDQPYMYRAGLGTLVKGLDDAVLNMKVGEKVVLEFGGDLAFGEKGRASAPGRPRIPPNADVTFEVLLQSLPGTGDDFIADFE